MSLLSNSLFSGATRQTQDLYLPGMISAIPSKVPRTHEIINHVSYSFVLLNMSLAFPPYPLSWTLFTRPAKYRVLWSDNRACWLRHSTFPFVTNPTHSPLWEESCLCTGRSGVSGPTAAGSDLLPWWGVCGGRPKNTTRNIYINSGKYLASREYVTAIGMYSLAV